MDPRPADAATGPPRHGVFLVTAGGAPGLTAAQVRHPRFVAPSRGVRFPASGGDPEPALTLAAVITA
ncbi:MAG: hypothetical protein ACYC90_14565, partial [Candidatus Nanopelagicales bacterium]